MPYVPRRDRKILDKYIDIAANEIIHRFKKEKRNQPFGGECIIIEALADAFIQIGNAIRAKLIGRKINTACPINNLGWMILNVASKYKYDGAWMGELNYSITRLIQVIPQKLVKSHKWKSELRYWIYAGFIGALTNASTLHGEFTSSDWIDISLAGVFIDIKDEYKRRVNISYEAAQINKSGDCYDTPYYTRLVEIIDEENNHFGFQEIMLRRTPETLKSNIVGILKLNYRG